MGKIGSRLYSTAIPLPDEDVDNVDTPYIIVTFEALNNDQTTKDDPFESGEDQVDISILIAAKTREQLAELTADVRKTVYDYMMAALSEDEIVIDDYRFSAEAVRYDSLKPCYWQTLRYSCDVTNEINNGQDESEVLE